MKFAVVSYFDLDHARFQNDTGSENILVVCGGIIPEQDIKALKDCGVAAVFGPGTNITKAALNVIDMIL